MLVETRDREESRGRSREVAALFGTKSGGGGLMQNPVLSSPGAGTPQVDGTLSATVVASIGSGILYRGCVTNGGSCTDAQLIAGTGGNLVAASCGNQVIIASGTQTIASIVGLTTATTYQIKTLAYGAGFYSLQASVNLTTA